jgi:hypothetical protein
MNCGRRSWIVCVLCLVALPLAARAKTGTALVRHAPTLNGRVEGSVQVITAEDVTLNGGAYVMGELLLPGTPAVQLNGNPTYGGTLDGAGAMTPTTHKVRLNGGASLGHVVRRTDAVALPIVAAPPQPIGTRNVSLTKPGESPGDFTTLKNLTLNSNVGQIVVPPGTYGNFGANAGSGFTLGIAGAISPAVYNFQNLTLNSNSTFTVVGPVIVTAGAGFSTNANMGAPDHPECLKLRIAAGGLTLNGNRSVYAHVDAPEGALILNGGAQLTGLVSSDRLTVNGKTPEMFSGDGLVPTASQVFCELDGFPGTAWLILEVTGHQVVHVDAPKQLGDLLLQLKDLQPDWFQYD